MAATDSLILCKASAGSGKTYRLACTYLNFLNEIKGDEAFRHILAVTFTNKATAEMKERIVHFLYNASQGKAKDTYLVDEKRAKTLLANLLHDYSHFQVSTIDSFFQRIVRSMVYELGLAGGYEVQVRDDEVLQQSVDYLIQCLGDPSNKDLLDFIAHWAEDQVNDNGSWNVQSMLKKLAKEVLNDNLKQQPPTYQEFSNYKQTLRGIKNESFANIKIAAQKLCKIVADNGYVCNESFKGKSKSPLVAVFKLTEAVDLGKGISAAADKALSSVYVDVDDFLPAKADSKLRLFVETTLRDACKQFYDTYQTNECLYFSAHLLLKTLPSYVSLYAIKEKVAEWQKQHEQLLLSFTTNLLHEVISKGDTPFVYEKTGTVLTHFLLDEFQDTSNVQWENFLPLLTESLSNGYKNLVVGDVKQSIYRFRNADWQILHQKLPTELKDYIKEAPLNTNYRSLPKVVDFNNRCFKYLSEQLTKPNADEAVKVSDLYADVKQECANDKKAAGRVELCCMDVPNNALAYTVNKMRVLHQKGYSYGQMGVLVNIKKEAKLVVDYLLKEGIPVVSDDALLLSSAREVQLLLAYISLAYLKGDKYKSLRLYNELLVKQLSSLLELLVLINSLPEDMQLYELVDWCVCQSGMLSKNARSLPYVQRFLDVLLNFITHNGAQAVEFLDWFQLNSKDLVVPSAENSDSVTVITIHKSKGLAYPLVFIPFCDWELSKKDKGYVWCKPTDKLEWKTELPIMMGSLIEKTQFAAAAKHDCFMQTIDNLNKLYVAFTRPQYGLYACLVNSNEKAPECKDGIASYLKLFAQQNMVEVKSADTCYTIYSCGEELPSLPPKEKVEVTVFEPYTGQCVGLPGFFCKASPQTERIRQGSQLHAIMERVVLRSDVDGAVNSLIRQGRISRSDAEQFRNQLHRYVDNPKVASWFDGTYQILNERSILTTLYNTEASYRPDRIMVKDGAACVVDYKFGAPDSKYIKQVRNYMQLLQQVGYAPVTGYIYYADQADPQEVSLT